MKLDSKKGWNYVMLADILDYVIGGDWGKDESFIDSNYELAYCIRGSEIKNWDINKGSTATLRKIKLANIDKRKLKEGDILIEISGGGPEQPVGRTVLIDNAVLRHNANIPKICTNFLRLMRPKKNIDPKFLNLFLNLFYYSGEIAKYQGGSNNLRNLKFQDFVKINIPLPPLETQLFLVSKIEELFSELDEAIENLKTAQLQLKTYRQAVLKLAFEGRLIKENVKEGELPEGWKYVKLGEVCTNVEYGSATKSKEIGKIPVLRMGNIQKGIFDWTNLVYTDNQDEIEKYSLKKDDVLFNRTNSAEWVGKTAIYKGEKPAIFAGYLIRINRIPDLIDANYLTYYLNTHGAKQYGNSIRSFGVNQSNINGTKLKTYPIPLPKLSEQQIIVQEIETRLSVADKIEESINQSLHQAEALRQSILKKAFEGKLK